MLVIHRKVGERIVLTGGIEVSVVSSSRGGVRLAVVAPKDIVISRGEVHDAVASSNVAAAATERVADPHDDRTEQNRSGGMAMIRMNDTRFGNLEVPENTAIEFPQGIIGFSEETRFILIERNRGNIGYLQSLRTPSLALPVIDASRLEARYAEDVANDLAQQGEDTDNLAVMVVVYVHDEDRSLRANLLAPIVVDANTRQARQIILDPEKYSHGEVIGTGECPSPEAQPTAC